MFGKSKKISVDLTEKKTSLIVKAFYVLVAFIAVYVGLLLLYTYLWQTLKTTVQQTFTPEDYVEATQTNCHSDADCSGACNRGVALGASQSCVCVKNACVFVRDSDRFAKSKFCDVDTDCVISCYEGPVSKEYFDRMGGAKNDCAEGCKTASLLINNGRVNQIVCRNHQCSYQNQKTCFMGTIPSNPIRQ